MTAAEELVKEFISEDDLQTFEGWLKYHGDAALTAPEDLETRRRSYEEMRERMAANPKVGRMKFRPLISGEHRYAVALREGSDLWLTLWVKRSRKPEFFVFQPRADGDWNPHTSYHLDGTLHMKSYDHKMVATKRQPLTGKFRGTESLGAHGGHGPKGVGAICDPTDFTGVVEVAPGLLGPRNGTVTVDLVEPGCEPIASLSTKIVQREIFYETVPWVVITIWS
jgi:hypothetical protein